MKGWPQADKMKPDSLLGNIFSPFYFFSPASAISVVFLSHSLDNKQRAYPRILYSKTQTAAKKARRADRTKGIK
jgi:hypothetical protein